MWNDPEMPLSPLDQNVFRMDRGKLENSFDELKYEF